MYRGIGISDDSFMRGKVPMTKSEVRAVAMSKLQIKEGMECLDVGCGTGSVSVEMAFATGDKGHIIALDNDPEATELTKENIRSFKLKNIDVILGEAPKDLPENAYDRVFIGGGGKRIEEIIRFSSKNLKDDGRLVVNAILIETLSSTLTAMEKFGFKNIGCICMNVAVGEKISGWMMKANNPIYIIWGEKGTICQNSME